MIKLVKEKFGELYEMEPIVVSAPGRINIIGEHTDYNDGLVLPAAIDKAIFFGISKNEESRLNLYSVDYNENYICEIEKVEKTSIQWANYIIGVVSALQGIGYRVEGFNAVIASDLPVGAGVSSSAALTSATIVALDAINSFGLSRLEMAKIAQQVEHKFAGVNCGIMDMFTSLMGKENHAIQLDCRDLQYNYIPIALGTYSLVLMNTNVKHLLASTEYNLRREECEKGVALVKQRYPSVQSLRDISMNMLDECMQNRNDVVYKRCSFIIQEIIRVKEASSALLQNNITELGKLLYETHDGLSKAYNVSCKELDYLVNAVKPMHGVIGARMMGGGFGGCTLNLIHQSQIETVVATVKEMYERDCELPFDHYVVNVGDGARIVSTN
jgi:galactokinase